MSDWVIYAFGELDTLVAAYAATIHKESGMRISSRRHSGPDAALSHAAAEFALHRRYSGQEAGRAGRAEKGRRHCCAKRVRATALVEVGGMAADERQERFLNATGVLIHS